MMPLTEVVAVFAPGVTVRDDLSVIPNALTLVAPAVPFNIHRGTDKSKDEAAAIGVFNVNAAEGYCAVASARLLTLRCVLKDASGTYWLIRDIAVRNRFPNTAHCRVLLTELEVAPDGAA